MGDDTPRYDKRIHALVSERQHEEWKLLTQGDDAPYESMSQLVRLSVQREIADENPGKGGDGSISGELEDTILDMADTLEGVDSRLSSVEKRLSKLEVESDEGTYELQGQVLNALPTDSGENPENFEEWAASVVDVAAQVNEDIEVVNDVLDELAEETGAVVREFGSEYLDGYGVYYYRRA